MPYSPEEETTAGEFRRLRSTLGGGAWRRGSVESAVRRGGGLGTEEMEEAGLEEARRKARAANGARNSPEPNGAARGI